MTVEAPHPELRCVAPSCTFDMREDEATKAIVHKYLIDLAEAVDRGAVRHVSVSVHRDKFKPNR